MSTSNETASPVPVAPFSALCLSTPVVIITGASTGIGAATARPLGRARMVIVLAVRRMDEIAAVARDITAARG